MTTTAAFSVVDHTSFVVVDDTSIIVDKCIETVSVHCYTAFSCFLVAYDTSIIVDDTTGNVIVDSVIVIVDDATADSLRRIVNATFHSQKGTHRAVVLRSVALYKKSES
jgi:hypothetical protein